MDFGQLKTLRNSTKVPQSVVYKGHQFILGPYEEQTFEQDIADQFLEKCSPVVVDTTEKVGSSYAPDFQAQTIWIANMTGNPDAPEYVKDMVIDKNTRRWVEVTKPNGNKVAKPVGREMKGGHRQFIARDGGMVQESLPSKTISVPPFRRRPLPAAEAHWFLERDAAASLTRGAVIESRPPSDFEPEMKWPLNDMRLYLKLIDPSADLGKSEEHLASDAKRGKWGVTQTTEALRQAKQLCLQRIYFRVVDPAYPLPTREEFYELKTGKSQADVESAEISAILAAAELENKQAVSNEE